MAADGGSTSTTHTLSANQELRLECPSGKAVSIKLEEGAAEVFGTELQRGKSVPVSGQKLAVFTWQGCKVTVEGEPSVQYVADETPMAQYLNTHRTLAARRDEARRAGASSPGSPAGRGPVVVVVGPTDSGKSTLCRLLCNWAVRDGYAPTFVDLDVGQGTITVPGCLSAVPVEQPIDLVEGINNIPIVFFYGHSSPGENPTLFKLLVDKLAGVLARRAAADPSVAAAGCVINTFGWVDGLGYELQKYLIQAFQCDVVLAMEQDRLHATLQQDLKAAMPRTSILKLAKSGGAVKREGEERRGAREARVRDYFYGAPGAPLQPATMTVKATDLAVYRIGSGPRAPNTALPIGAVSLADPLRLQALPPSLEMLQAVMAVSHAPTPDQILNMNVAGFVLIKDVDTARGTVTLVAPAAGQLPGRYLITGTLRSSID
ncbi:hypothetical protein CHLRE_03g194800v5 [Chlamydomonas reinhardtii]|uniref:Protein CLP1 homolog n=1 Tax=Chlamydomonas reinhardtii TaxID=3055 RepID=A0A2K3DYJ8_CHLRE|nr:uncharacterized protein CHLRE_03g194800v5 [Chlamydomonas reinhardtii]PNW85613.1 hypothetical protein CHLRE_03g194800v5 [Chlamydomonas reinhardtii]